MRKAILALVVSVVTINSVTEVQAAPGKRTVIKRKKKGVPDSQADGKRKTVAEPKVKEAPPAPEVKGSGMNFNEGETRESYRERNRPAKAGSEPEQPKMAFASDMSYTPQFIVGCGRYGVGSEAEKATLHTACEIALRIGIKKKDWAYTPFLETTIQMSPYDGFLIYKKELDYGMTRMFGDISLGVSNNLEFGKSVGEVSIGGETADGSHWTPILKGRLVSQPKDGLFTELALLTVGNPRTEAKLTVTTNQFKDGVAIGGYFGSRFYNATVRHDRLGPVVRYQADSFAIEGTGEYAFDFGYGGGIKIAIPKFW